MQSCYERKSSFVRRSVKIVFSCVALHVDSIQKYCQCFPVCKRKPYDVVPIQFCYKKYMLFGDCDVFSRVDQNVVRLLFDFLKFVIY